MKVREGRAGIDEPGHLSADGSLHLGQYLSQVVETASPCWPDTPDWHAQLLGDLLVWEIAVAHQQTEKTLAARR